MRYFVTRITFIRYTKILIKYDERCVQLINIIFIQASIDNA